MAIQDALKLTYGADTLILSGKISSMLNNRQSGCKFT
jgi:hypothetical protein